MSIDKSMGRETFWRRPALDGTGRIMRRQKRAVIAVTIRDALLVVIIIHAVFTVINAPRRTQ